MLQPAKQYRTDSQEDCLLEIVPRGPPMHTSCRPVPAPSTTFVPDPYAPQIDVSCFFFSEECMPCFLARARRFKPTCVGSKNLLSRKNTLLWRLALDVCRVHSFSAQPDPVSTQIHNESFTDAFLWTRCLGQETQSRFTLSNPPRALLLLQPAIAQVNKPSTASAQSSLWQFGKSPSFAFQLFPFLLPGCLSHVVALCPTASVFDAAPVVSIRVSQCRRFFQF